MQGEAFRTVIAKIDQRQHAQKSTLFAVDRLVHHKIGRGSVLDGGKCILQLRGVRPFKSDKYDITQHPNYKYLSDADPKNNFDIEKFLSTRLKTKPNDKFDTYEITDTLKQLTHDHTFVQQEVDAGHMTAQEALTSNKRHILTRCIGAREDMAPDFFSGKVKKDAVYMLCSDGFRHTVSEQEFIQHLSPVTINCDEDLKKREVYLIDVNKQRRENDNISVVTVAAR